MANSRELLPVEKIDATTSVGNLGLSTRIVNALRNVGIDTYGKLADLTYEELLAIPKMGQVSASETMRIVSALKKGIQLSKELTIRIDKEDWALQISVLGLNKRAYHSLLDAQIVTLGQLAELKVEDLLLIKGIGVKTLDHITQCVEIFYAEKHRDDVSLSNLGLDNRTFNALKRADILYLSELEDMSIEEISNLRGMGEKSLDRLLKQIKATTGKEIISCRERYQLITDDDQDDTNCILIDELDFSTRALNALKNSGFRYVDEILELKPSDLLALRNIGQKSFEDIQEELKRYQSVDYEEITFTATKLDDYVELLQRALSKRQKDILNRRLGTYSLYAETLESIAKDYGLSRERIRQIEKKAKKKMFSPSNSNIAKPLFDIIVAILNEQGGMAGVGHISDELLKQVPAENINITTIIPVFLQLAGCKEISEGLWALTEIDIDEVVEIERKTKEILSKKAVPVDIAALVNEVSCSLSKMSVELPDSLVESSIRNNKGLRIDKGNQVHLLEWNSFTPQNRVNYVVNVLESLGRPAHYREIALRVNERLPKEAQYSIKSIQVVLGSSDLFVRVGVGTYALATWWEQQTSILT